MPLYEFECARHGAFTLMRPMARAGEDGPCPTCARASKRVITAPNLFTMRPLQREAAARNEKSRHAPHVCTSGCGHVHRHAKPQAAAARPTRERGATLQAYRGPRSWVVEHR